MGTTLDRFSLYPSGCAERPWLLTRVTRPAAPNAAQPAVDFADDLACAKSDALVRAWLVCAGLDGGSVPAAVGTFYPTLDEECDDDRSLLSFAGGELDLWWSYEEGRPRNLAIGPGVDEPGFWRWLDEFLSERRLGKLRRPAEAIRVQLLTEADARLVDRPLLMIDDVDWLSMEEFNQLHRHGGLEALLAEVLPMSPAVTPSELRAVKLGLVRRALDDDVARQDRRAAAFRCAELARYDPAGALAMIATLAAWFTLHGAVNGVVWALAYALDRIGATPDREALIDRWRVDTGEGKGRFTDAVLAELAGIAALR